MIAGEGTAPVERDARGGFALAMVVLLLFAVGAAAAASYQLVQTEAQLGSGSSGASEALAAAHGGLERYMIESIGVPADSTTYMIDSIDVVVRSRRLLEIDAVTDLFLLEASAATPDGPRLPPVRRRVARYALLHKAPVRPFAALMATAYPLNIEGASSDSLWGRDTATPADCPGGGTMDVAAVASRVGPTTSDFEGSLQGSPPTRTLPDYGMVVRDSTGVRWDVLQDDDFNVGMHDGSFPDFSTLPSDSFPLIRVPGELIATSTHSGRGALIVTYRIWPQSDFTWEGIILAGELRDFDGAQIHGALITGLDGSEGGETVSNPDILWNSCDFAAANRALAYFEPVEGTWWEQR